jgi:hypothetical protein
MESSIYNIKEISTITYKCCTEIKEHILWQKLQDILKVEWNTFQFFGIAIKDTALIQKVFGLIIALIFAQNIMSISNFAAL